MPRHLVTSQCACMDSWAKPAYNRVSVRLQFDHNTYHCKCLGVFLWGLLRGVFQRWDFIENGGIWNPTVEYDFPRWDFLLACPASRHPSIRESTKGGGQRPPPFVEAAEGHPYGWMSGSWVGKQEIPPWKIILHSRISHPTVFCEIPPLKDPMKKTP